MVEPSNNLSVYIYHLIILPPKSNSRGLRDNSKKYKFQANLFEIFVLEGKVILDKI